jgi:hypothetical protein
LTALHFGIEELAIKKIQLAGDEYLDRSMPATGPITSVPIESKEVLSREWSGTGFRDESIPSRLPADCTGLAEYKLEHPEERILSSTKSKLKMFLRPLNERESLKLTVYFTTFPDSVQENSFREIIKGWETMGWFGGFGGGSIANFGELKFDRDTESAAFEADMGASDPNIALPILIRVLEGYDSSILPIEAVVFGYGTDGA